MPEAAARRHLRGGQPAGQLPSNSRRAHHADVQHPSSPPSGRAQEIIRRRALPPSHPEDQSERPGPDLLRPGHFPAAGQLGEGEEKLIKARIGVSQVPCDVAEGTPPAQAQAHRDVRERAA